MGINEGSLAERVWSFCHVVNLSIVFWVVFPVPIGFKFIILWFGFVFIASTVVKHSKSSNIYGLV